eukprot:g18746.t1
MNVEHAIMKPAPASALAGLPETDKFLLGPHRADQQRKLSKQIQEDSENGNRAEVLDDYVDLVSRVEKNLVKALYLLLNDRESKMQILIFERSIRAILIEMTKIHSQRMQKVSRIFAYAKTESVDLDFEQFEELRSETGADKSKLRWVFQEAAFMTGANCEIDENAPFLAGPLYNFDLRKIHNPPAHQLDRVTYGATTYRKQPAVGAGQFERAMASRTIAVKQAGTQAGDKIVAVLSGTEKWYIAKEFDFLMGGIQELATVELMTKWAKIRIPNTRDVEAHGGEFPWAMNEHNVSHAFPWMVPTSKCGAFTSDKGNHCTFSAFDGRVPLSEIGVADQDELRKHVWGDDLTFEANTPGLVLPTDVALACKKLKIGDDEDTEALKKVQIEMVKQTKMPADKLVREEIKNLFSLEYRGATGLSDEETKELCKFKFPIGNWPRVLFAEMTIYEHYSYLCDESWEAKANMQRGRQNVFFLFGVLQKRRAQGLPTFLEIHCPLNKTRVVQLLMVILQTQTLLVLELVEDVVPVRSADRFGPLDHWQDRIDTPSATVREQEQFDVCNRRRVQVGHGVNKWHGLEGAFAKTPYELPVGMPMVERAPDEEIYYRYPTSVSSYMYPLPTSDIAMESKLKPLFITSKSILQIKNDYFDDIRVVMTAKYCIKGEEDDSARMSLEKHGRAMRPLAAALHYGFATDENFSKGTNSAVKADLQQTCKYLLEENPLRIRNIMKKEAPAYLPKQVEEWDEKWLKIKRSASKEFLAQPEDENFNADDVTDEQVLALGGRLEAHAKNNYAVDGDGFNVMLQIMDHEAELTDQEKLFKSVWHRNKFEPIAKSWVDILFALCFGQEEGEKILRDKKFCDIVTVNGASGPDCKMVAHCQAMWTELVGQAAKVKGVVGRKEIRDPKAKKKANADVAAQLTRKKHARSQREIARQKGIVNDPFLDGAERSLEDEFGVAYANDPDEEDPEGELRMGGSEAANPQDEEFLKKVKDLRVDFLRNEEGRKLYEKTQKCFHADLDFIMLHAKALEAGYEDIACGLCDQATGRTKPVWLGASGPQLVYTDMHGTKQKQKACGPCSHLRRKSDGDKHQRYCGADAIYYLRTCPNTGRHCPDEHKHAPGQKIPRKFTLQMTTHGIPECDETGLLCPAVVNEQEAPKDSGLQLYEDNNDMDEL